MRAALCAQRPRDALEPLAPQRPLAVPLTCPAPAGVPAPTTTTPWASSRPRLPRRPLSPICAARSLGWTNGILNQQSGERDGRRMRQQHAPATLRATRGRMSMPGASLAPNLALAPLLRCCFSPVAGWSSPAWPPACTARFPCPLRPTSFEQALHVWGNGVRGVMRGPESGRKGPFGGGKGGPKSGCWRLRARSNDLGWTVEGHLQGPPCHKGRTRRHGGQQGRK